MCETFSDALTELVTYAHFCRDVYFPDRLRPRAQGRSAAQVRGSSSPTRGPPSTSRTRRSLPRWCHGQNRNYGIRKNSEKGKALGTTSREMQCVRSGSLCFRTPGGKSAAARLLVVPARSSFSLRMHGNAICPGRGARRTLRPRRSAVATGHQPWLIGICRFYGHLDERMD